MANEEKTAGAGVSVAQEEGGSHLRIRRRVIWSCIITYLAANFYMFLRFFFPRALFEPKTVFKIGYPSDYALGVDTKFQKQYRIWVDRKSTRLNSSHIQKSRMPSSA